jgi:DNA invertase Pin-like site-specific DNA recombinase
MQIMGAIAQFERVLIVKRTKAGIAAGRAHGRVRAFEAGFEVGAKPIDETVVESVLSLRIDDLEPRLTRSGYDVRSLAEQFNAKPRRSAACCAVILTRHAHAN